MSESERDELIEACNRLLKTEREVSRMPRWARRWFFQKPGHADAFRCARALKKFLRAETLWRRVSL